MAITDSLYLPDSWFKRLDWNDVFSRPAPVEVDIGCGDGSFIVQRAKNFPEHNFLGIERLLGRARKVPRKAARAGLQNVRAIRMDASYALEWLIPEKSVTCFYLLFPDPWPKRRHLERRMFNGKFAEVTARGAAPQGFLRVATDVKDYFEQMLEVAASSGYWKRVPNSLWEQKSEITDFEAEFQKEGRSFYRAEFVKVER